MSTRGTDRAGSAEGTATGTGGRGVVVALAALIVLLWAGTSVLYGYGLYVVAVLRDADVAAVLPQVVAGILVLGFAPSLGMLELQRGQGVRASDGSGARPVRLYVWLGITALFAVAHAVASAVAGVPLLVTVGFLLGAVGTAATSWILVIRAKRAADVRRSERGPDADLITIDLDWTAGTARRKWRTIWLVLAASLVLALVGLLLLPRSDPEEFRQGLAVVIQFASLAPMAACLLVSLGAQMSAGAITAGVTAEERKAVARRASGKGGELEPELEWRAARLAVYSGTVQPFQLAQTLFLLVGISVPTLLRGGAGWLEVAGIVLILLAVATMPWVVMQQRRVKRYADTVRDLARSHVPQPEATAA